ncbi:iron-containing alcohol dehydrogenase [Candidatus Mycoplasma haematominutum]|uniref:Uncharacterized protein n=1 Tax=Candidatus Mycoplasma haematominutum 'Birmingham 1' TaxID=1116213 RepID=G8C3C0_9MOLU|nr:iron-containing alcohol dehydrogenase [Candidatus Mycoplasma haematominutum]CCE66818.1 conserved hypothetical protein (alcoholdehydrogenase) [Candidatus Mycoplasma haematominutum 'Birmingham 1']
MLSVKSKARNFMNKLFPPEQTESIEESIYKNGLDSQMYFSAQREALNKELNHMQKSISAESLNAPKLLLSGAEEIEFSKLKELIMNHDKFWDTKISGAEDFVSPNYTALVEKKEKLKAEGKASQAELEPIEDKERKIPLLHNWSVGEDAVEELLSKKLAKAGVNALIVLTDDAYTRQLVGYRRIISILQDLKIEFFEYTNIQPLVDRDTALKVVEYAYKCRANSFLVVGSNSLIDFSKLIIKNLIKPNSIKLYSNRSKPVVSAYYSIFSVPTLVMPSPKIVEQSVLVNKPFLKKLDYFDQSIYLFNPIDSSDHVFYYPVFILEYPKKKQMELLHLLFFKLLFSYFDSELNSKDRMRLIREVKSIEWYLNYLLRNSDLTLVDAKIIMEIAAKCFDGRYFMTKSSYWTWYKLAANLTQITKIELYKSLALFLPSFLEYITLNDKEGHDRALELAYIMYGVVSTEGLLLYLIKHIEKFGLPTKFFDIPFLKDIDTKFIQLLMKQASPMLCSHKISKTIIQNLAVW